MLTSIYLTSNLVQSAILEKTTTPTSIEQREAHYNEVFEITKQITGLYLMPLITVLGIVGNVLIVIVYQKSQKYSTNLYLIVLSMSDILKLSNDFLYFVVNLTNKIDSNLSEKIFNSLYLYSHYIFVFTAINTAWLTCTIAIDRFITVSNNRPKQTLSSYYKSIGIAICLFVVSALISIPSPLFLATVDEFDPHVNKTVVKITETRLNRSTFRVIYNYFTALVRAFIPLILLIYLNFRILRIVYKNKMKKKYSNKLVRKSKTSVTLMLSTIILAFVVCMFPDALLTMMQFGYVNETSLIKAIREITDLLLTINSAITFPICIYFSIEFQSKIKKLCFNCETKVLQSFDTRSSRSPKKSLKDPNFPKENEKLNQIEPSPFNHKNKTESTDVSIPALILK